MFQTDFDPNDLDQVMRNQLSDSLQYIFVNAGNDLKVDLKQATPILNKIRQRQVTPSVFAHYYDIVFAMKAKQFTIAQQLAQELLILIDEVSEFEILPYSKVALAADYERFPRLVFAGYCKINPMATPDQDLYHAHLEKLQQALEIIQAVDNSIYLEIKALVSRVIVTIYNRESESARPYGGASSFMTWGAIFINAELYNSLYQVVEFYVHELTHCVLFGFSCQQPLVLNSASENYQSSLRSDARPMDGVYHSTLVCARLALFMQKWQAYGAIDDNHGQWLEQHYQLYLNKFFDGATVINRHAKLSEQGAQIFKEAEFKLSKNRR